MGRANGIRSPKFQDAKMCRSVLGYDVNALCPSTIMLGAMPCDKEVVVHWPQKQGNVKKFIEVLQRDRRFGFA